MGSSRAMISWEKRHGGIDHTTGVLGWMGGCMHGWIDGRIKAVQEGQDWTTRRESFPLSERAVGRHGALPWGR